MKQYGKVFATPGVAEKGYLDTRIDIATAGGHSSVPPSHTVRVHTAFFCSDIDS